MVGGGIGMGKTCEPKAFSFQCMTKFTTNKNFKKIKKKKRKCNTSCEFTVSKYKGKKGRKLSNKGNFHKLFI